MTKESKRIMMKLPPAVQEELANNVYRSEEILWADKPCTKLTDDYGLLYFILSFFCGGLIFFVYQEMDIESRLDLKLFIPIISISIGMALMPFYNEYISNKTGYVLTNSRAIIIQPDKLWPWNMNTKSYPLTVDLIVGIKMKGTRGDIIFGESVQGYVTSHLGNGLSVTSQSKKKYGFMNCPNAKRVANYMHEYAEYLIENRQTR